MEVSKALQINTAYKDSRTTPNWETRLFADIVIVDKTHSNVNPSAYQLRDNEFTLNNDSLTSTSTYSTFSAESFILLGEVLTIEKHKKQILLSNQNIVAYRYLITVSGNRFPFQQPEFSAGLQTLIDAVRVTPKFHDSLSTAASPYTRKAPEPIVIDTHEKKVPKSDIEKLVQLSISDGHNGSLSFNVINKRLYVIQL